MRLLLHCSMNARCVLVIWTLWRFARRLAIFADALTQMPIASYGLHKGNASQILPGCKLIAGKPVFGFSRCDLCMVACDTRADFNGFICHMFLLLTMINALTYPLSRKSCKTCDGKPLQPPAGCVDHHVNCKLWADAGECKRNPMFMHHHCSRSCHVCQYMPCMDYGKTSACSDPSPW